jgi:hypothetical protein
MPVQALKSNDFVIEKITIDEFHNLYLQSIKGSFYRNDAIKKATRLKVLCVLMFVFNSKVPVLRYKATKAIC